MKKILAVVALLSCGVAAYGAAPDFKAPSDAGTIPFGTDTNGSIDFKPSANVAMAYDATAATGVSYVVGAVHAQGSRIYGSSSVDTNIFYIDHAAPGIADPGTALDLSDVTFPESAASGSTPSSYFGEGWTASK